MSVRIGSLCSGYGGLDMGLRAVVGGEVAWHCENDPGASRVLAHHWPDVPNYGDVTDLPFREMEQVDWLTAGYPCQPFSQAGRRKGTDDERHLWPYIAAAIGALRPGHVLLENVAGHLTLGFATVLADLVTLGYDATWGVVRASDAGATHLRARLFVTATDARSARFGQHAGESLAQETRSNEGNESRRHGPWKVTPDAHKQGPQGPKSARRPDISPGSVVADSAGDTRRFGDRDDTLIADSYVNGLTRFGRQFHERPDVDRRSSQDVAWGVYEPAIRRWERVIGRDAPRPTEPGRSAERLSPRFVEWMLGLPEGHVTGVGLTRTQELTILGNGVVPQQAALAVSSLLALAVTS